MKKVLIFLLFISLVFMGTTANASEGEDVITPVESFMESLERLSPKTHQIIKDFFLIYSCGEKSVYNYSMEDLERFLASDTAVVFMHGQLSISEDKYNYMLNVLYKANCAYKGFFGDIFKSKYGSK